MILLYVDLPEVLNFCICLIIIRIRSSIIITFLHLSAAYGIVHLQLEFLHF